jgi:pyridoxal phosphate enzyme (YggS family)
LILENVAALRNAVNHKQVTIVAVTKTQPVERIREAVNAGLTVLGENRVQEAAEKVPALAGMPVEWHLIGHLQTNKVKQAVALFSLIQSVDSLKLAAEIDRQARLAGKVQDVLLQINVAGEESKFGIDPADAVSLTSALEALPNIRLCGLMTIAPFFAEAEQTRPIFRQTKQLFDQLKQSVAKPEQFCRLSMGMTHDYAVAIEEGANMIRVGSGIFGERTTR